MIQSTDPNVRDSPFVAWNNLIGTGTLTATSTAAGFPVAGLLNGYTTDPWRPASMPATVALELPDPAPASAACFAGHDMHTQGVSVVVERRVGASWEAVASYTPQSNDPFILSFQVADAAQWRFVFSGDTPFRLAVLHISRALVFPSSTRIQPPHTPLHRVSRVELIGGSESGTGEFLQADTMRTGGRASLEFSVQLPALMLSDDFDGFRNHFNKGRPFFFASFPRYEPRDMGYVWRDGPDIVTPYQDAVFMSLGMDVGVYVV